MDEFSNMTIDYVQELLPINPGESSRLRVDIRNTGNIPTLPNMNLEIINENGQINTELGALDRHIVDDWTVGIFGGLEFQTLEPNESRSIEIGFQAPNLNEGGLSVRLQFAARKPVLEEGKHRCKIRDSLESVSDNVNCFK